MVEVLRLRTHGVGPRFVREAFAGAADLDHLSWQQTQAIFDRAGGPYSYGLTSELRNLGRDAVDLVLDLDLVRHAWEREHGPIRTDLDQRQALALAAIEVLEPRVVIDLNMKTFSFSELREVRRSFPALERTIGVANVMKRLDRAFGHDLVLTPSRPLMRLLRRLGGPPSELFHHAFEPPGNDPSPASDRTHSAVFSGSVGDGVYARRRELLRRLLAEGLVEAWVKEQRRRPSTTGEAPRRWTEWARRSVPVRVVPTLRRRTGRGSDLLDVRMRAAVVPRPSRASVGSTPDGSVPARSLHEEFPDRCHPAVFGAEMFDLLGRSRVVVHDEVNGAATSLRLFEATGMGTALVTDASEGLDELFDLGSEVLVYRTVDEAVELVRGLRDDPPLAERIGAAGRARTMRDHTDVSRARQLDGILSAILKAR